MSGKEEFLLGDFDPSKFVKAEIDFSEEEGHGTETPKKRIPKITPFVTKYSKPAII